MKEQRINGMAAAAAAWRMACAEKAVAAHEVGVSNNVARKAALDLILTAT